MKQMRILRRGISLNNHPSKRLPVSTQPPSQGSRDSAIANAVQRKAAEGAPKQASPAVPELGWLWQAGKGTSAGAVADLRQDRIKPKKSLGQNFVTDDSILESIVKASGVKPGDLVLEIGPGTGNLTRHLLAAGARVTAVEKDDVLYARLVETFGQRSSDLHVVHGDVLKVDLKDLLHQMTNQPRDPSTADGQVRSTTSSSPSSSSLSPSSQPSSPSSGFSDPEASMAQPPSRSAPAATSSSSSSSSSQSSASVPSTSGTIKVVANLPYNITKDFLKVLLPMGALVSELHIMIQEEVARRLVTRKPGGSDYRAMNLYVMFYSKPVYRFIIPKDRYYPVPGVDGALVSFKLLAPDKRLPVPSEREFLRLVSQGFSERRKMLRNNLQPSYSSQQVEQALVALGFLGTLRAQDLNVDDFVRLHQQLHKMLEAPAAS